MDDDLVAVGHFFSSGEAHIARSRLVAEGIDAEVVDDITSDMDWLLTNAIHGVKLLVRKSDEERAAAMLADRVADDEVEQAYRESEDSVDEPADNIEPTNAREHLADRSYRAAVISLGILPLHLYTFWMLIRVFVSDESMRPEHRRRAWIAAAINIPVIVLFCIVLRIMIRG